MRRAAVGECVYVVLELVSIRSLIAGEEAREGDNIQLGLGRWDRRLWL